MQGVLRDTISLLLLRLLDDRSLLRFEEGPTLVKAVNVLMLKAGWGVGGGGMSGPQGKGWQGGLERALVLLGGRRNHIIHC